MDKKRELQKIAQEIARCRTCKKGGMGKVVPGEGSPDARVVFIGEAPGKEEAKLGRPFIGRSGRFLRQMIADIDLAESDIFITSPGHYLPLRGTPTKEAILHGREHLFKQIEVISPGLIVLLGSTACFAMLDRKVEISKDHGAIVKKNGRIYLITFHPAYAMRFPEGKKHFIGDFRVLKRMIQKSESFR